MCSLRYIFYLIFSVIPNTFTLNVLFLIIMYRWSIYRWIRHSTQITIWWCLIRSPTHATSICCYCKISGTTMSWSTCTCLYERTCTTCCRTTSTTRTTSWASTWAFTSTRTTVSTTRAYSIMVSAVVTTRTLWIRITFRALRSIARDCRTACITSTIMRCCAVSCARATWWTFWITATCWTIWVVCTYFVCTVIACTIIFCYPLCIQCLICRYFYCCWWCNLRSSWCWNTTKSL